MNSEENFEDWLMKKPVQDYLELSLEEALNPYSSNPTNIVTEINFDNNYGYLFKTIGFLNPEDKMQLVNYFVYALKEEGYKLVNKNSENYPITLQACVKQRVHGEQLYGTIKIFSEPGEIRVLVTPFNDHQYNESKCKAYPPVNTFLLEKAKLPKASLV